MSTGASPLDVFLLALLVGLCLAVALIDWRSQIIPNALNAAVASLGLARAALGGPEAAALAVAQGAAAFCLFWLIRRLYQAIRSVHGLGLGDVKFLGAAGLWVGVPGLPPMVLVACASALAWVGIAHLRGKTADGGTRIAFGPFLALSLLAMAGPSLLHLDSVIGSFDPFGS